MNKLPKMRFEGEEPDKKRLLLEALLEKLSTEDNTEVDIEEYTEKLLATTKHFQTEKHSFKEGDLVVWKKGLKHKQVPEYGVPAIVIKVLEIPIVDNEAPLASPYYREELDVLLGILDDDDDLLCFYYDSKRFEPFTKQ
jgi:hypothetical protein